MSNCPTSLPLSQLTDTDEFKNILSGEDLLNLTDPTKQLNQALLLATTDTINDKLDGQKTRPNLVQVNLRELFLPKQPITLQLVRR